MLSLTGIDDFQCNIAKNNCQLIWIQPHPLRQPSQYQTIWSFNPGIIRQYAQSILDTGKFCGTMLSLTGMITPLMQTNTTPKADPALYLTINKEPGGFMG